jgi:PAS domain S-box-containing protein
MPTGDSRFQLSADPRLAPYAAASQAAWLWSPDGSRILWCNPAGMAALGIGEAHDAGQPLSPADPHGRQIAQLARRLPRTGVTRLERLRGFGARLAQLATCACTRLALGNGETAILLVAVEPSHRLAPPPPPPVLLAASGAHDIADTTSGEPRAADLADAGHAAPAEQPTPALQDADMSAPAPSAQRPLRFVWQIDPTDRFLLTSDEFLRIAGERSARLQGQPWSDVAHALDVHGRLTQAIGAHETFSSIAVRWPLDTPGRVELSGMPIFDGARNFAGYRGFGICRFDAMPADDLSSADAPAEDMLLVEDMPAADAQNAPIDDTPVELPQAEPADPVPPVAVPAATDSPPEREIEIVEPPQNVVPFPLTSDTRTPSLSAIENHAFDEIARRLTQNFQERDGRKDIDSSSADHDTAHEELPTEAPLTTTSDQPAWLSAAAPQPRGDSTTDRTLLDLMPSGILIYRLDRLLYANRAFLTRTAYDNLLALQEAGGLDALYVEPGPASTSSASDGGMPLTIAPSGGASVAARLFSILWDGENAHALILQDLPAAPAAPVAAAAAPPPAAPTAPAADQALEAILETATDGIILFDRSGAITSANRSAETMFGTAAPDLRTVNFADLFAADSQRIVLDYFESLDTPAASRPAYHGREVFGRVASGSYVPLSMTMGRIGDDSERYFAVFRDLSQLKRNESDLLSARRKADRANTAKADALASISHELRGPLNTIIGFANLMVEERFGGLGNERYADYLKDIRASGERAVAILNDIVNISTIESGNIDLRLVSQNLNDMVEQCVGALQPQANRERVIIRTSLAHALPQVMADTQALRQITMNIVTSSIRFSRAGGQVIVSTAPAEHGGAVLRVRDAGRRPNETELSAMVGSHRAAADRSAIDLSLARALAEANRAQFHIRTTENAGTLIEVTFASIRALAG